MGLLSAGPASAPAVQGSTPLPSRFCSPCHPGPRGGCPRCGAALRALSIFLCFRGRVLKPQGKPHDTPRLGLKFTRTYTRATCDSCLPPHRHQHGPPHGHRSRLIFGTGGTPPWGCTTLPSGERPGGVPPRGAPLWGPLRGECFGDHQLGNLRFIYPTLQLPPRPTCARVGRIPSSSTTIQTGPCLSSG